MQIPTEWIKEFCGLDTTDDQMANQLTMAGVECELLSTSNQEILDLSLTPNRADCFSVLGICRELSILNNLNIKIDNYDNSAVHHQDEINIEIESPNDCPVFMTRVINNIDVNAKTPEWMTKRLENSGIKSNNVIVDITNYVMLETGQPLHAYDLSKIDNKIKVRRGRNREKISLLDETVKKVNKDYLFYFRGY